MEEVFGVKKQTFNVLTKLCSRIALKIRLQRMIETVNGIIVTVKLSHFINNIEEFATYKKATNITNCKRLLRCHHHRHHSFRLLQQCLIKWHGTNHSIWTSVAFKIQYKLLCCRYSILQLNFYQSKLRKNSFLFLDYVWAEINVWFHN